MVVFTGRVGVEEERGELDGLSVLEARDVLERVEGEAAAIVQDSIWRHLSLNSL